MAKDKGPEESRSRKKLTSNLLLGLRHLNYIIPSDHQHHKVTSSTHSTDENADSREVK